MRKLAAPLALASLVALPACQWRAKRDWNHFCELATRINEDASIEPMLKSVELARGVAEMSWKSEGFTNTFGALAGADPTTKYELMKRGAAESGYEGWECPAYSEFASPTSEPLPTSEAPPPSEP